jgi:uncharacterized ferritin-like protein (DUF455 family)
MVRDEKNNNKKGKHWYKRKTEQKKVNKMTKRQE